MTKPTSTSESALGDLFGDGGQVDTASDKTKRKLIMDTSVFQPSLLQTASQFFTIDEVAKRYRVSRSTVWRWVEKNQRFPPPIRLSSGVSRWPDYQLLEFEKCVSFRKSRKTNNSTKSPNANPNKGQMP